LRTGPCLGLSTGGSWRHVERLPTVNRRPWWNERTNEPLSTPHKIQSDDKDSDNTFQVWVGDWVSVHYTTCVTWKRWLECHWWNVINIFSRSSFDVCVSQFLYSSCCIIVLQYWVFLHPCWMNTMIHHTTRYWFWTDSAANDDDMLISIDFDQIISICRD